MPASGYVDQRFNLRPPLLVVCFAFGVFTGFYLNALRVRAQQPVDQGYQPTTQAEPPPKPDELTGEMELPPDPAAARPMVAEIAPVVTPEVTTDPGGAPLIDLATMVPPDPPVLLSPQVGLTAFNASPPTFSEFPSAPTPPATGAVGPGGRATTPGPERRTTPGTGGVNRRELERLAPR